jgi:hypothetical protein
MVRLVFPSFLDHDLGFCFFRRCQFVRVLSLKWVINPLGRDVSKYIFIVFVCVFITVYTGLKCYPPFWIQQVLCSYL